MNRATPQPHDATLPQLGIALDARAMRAVFDGALRRQHGTRVTGCRVDRVKYRPQRNCTVSWLLDIENGRDGATSVQRAAGRFCAAGEAAARHGRHRARASLSTRCGTDVLLVPELELFAWFVPNDPKLAGLPALCEVVQNDRVALDGALAAMTGQPVKSGDVRAGLVQYVPESRACARFDLELPDGRRECLFAKVDSKNHGAATHRAMRALFDSPAQRAGQLRTPRPLLWQPATGLNWQQAVPGEPLIDRHWHCPPPIATRIGRLIAALHSTPVDLAWQVGGDSLMDHPRECAAVLARVEPAWRPMLDRVLMRLEADLAPIRSLPLATLHGDLHPGNILLNGDELYLIDLDTACAGAAVLDVGGWIADGLYRALLKGTSLAAVQESTAHLLAAYQTDSPHLVDGKLLAWATARALLCDRAYRGVANLKPGRLEIVPALLTLAAFIARHGVEDLPLPNL